ncbi:GNAT family N-acetyltransferase [Thermodesulfobacteriota bacterium]
MAPAKRFKGVDREGACFEAELCEEGHFSALTEMYDSFPEMALAQGLPPPQKEGRHRWVKHLVDNAMNFVVWEEGKAVGHSALIVDLQRGDGEYIIFVRDSFRHRGLGTHLTAMALEHGRSMGLSEIWLTVESFNFRAMKLYRKVGFEFADQGTRERTMVFRL